MVMKQNGFRGSHARFGRIFKNLGCALLASTIIGMPAFSQDYPSLAKKLCAGENVSIKVEARKVQDNVYQQLQKLQKEIGRNGNNGKVVVKSVRASGGELDYVFGVQKIKGGAGEAHSGESNAQIKNSANAENAFPKREAGDEDIKQVLPGGKLGERVFPEEEGPVKGPSWQKWDVDTAEAVKGIPPAEEKEIFSEEEPLMRIDSTAKTEGSPAEKKKNGKAKNANNKQDLLAYADKLSDDGKFDEAIGIYENRVGDAKYTPEVQLKIARNLMLGARKAVGGNLFEKYDDEKNANLKAYVYYDDAIRILKMLEARESISGKGREEIRTLLSIAYRGRGVCGSYYGARKEKDMHKDLDSSQIFQKERWFPKNNLKH